MRLAEIINDFRTLLIHIPQQNVSAPPEDAREEGFTVMRECLSAARNLMASNYMPSGVPSGASNEEAEKMELQRYAAPFATLPGGRDQLRLTDSNRVILDGSARRFQAHRIYLRIAAAKRWAHHRSNVLRGQRPTTQHSAQLTAVNNTFRRVSLSHSRIDLSSVIWNRVLLWTRTNSRDLHYNRNWHK